MIELYKRLELPEKFIEHESSLVNEFTFARTNDRSLLGSMNDIVHQLQSWTENQVSGHNSTFDSFEDSMAVLPFGPVKYQYPINVACSIIGQNYQLERDIDEYAKKIIMKL